MEQAPSQEQVLQNSEVRLSIHRKPSCQVEFEVEASSSLVQAAHKKAIKLIAKEVTLPGFRKGKAPDHLIAKNFSEQVDKKWQEIIADLSFRESEKLAQLPLLHRDARIVYKMKKHSSEGAELTLTFETEPEIPSVDPKLFKAETVKRPEVNDEKVDETIRQVQLFFAEWKKITDRPAKQGDFVILDVDVIETDPPEKLFANTRFEITEKSMAKWMRDLVIGLSTNQTAEGVSTPDEDVKPEEKEAFKPKKVRITLKAIEEATFPSLNDEFAQKLGVKNVDDLRNSIQNLLNTQADAHVQEALREQASAFLINKYPFDLPKTLIEKETHFRLRQLFQDPEFQKHWNAMSDQERENMVQSISQQSEKAVRMFYICRKVLSDAHIPVTAKDLPAAPNTPLEALLNPRPYLFPHQENETRQAEAYSRIVLEKAEDYIIANATS